MTPRVEAWPARDLNFSQAHNVTNALAAIGAAHALGIALARSPRARAGAFSSLRERSWSCRTAFSS